jgi:hypothetical protein
MLLPISRTRFKMLATDTPSLRPPKPAAAYTALQHPATRTFDRGAAEQRPAAPACRQRPEPHIKGLSAVRRTNKRRQMLGSVDFGQRQKVTVGC